MLTTMSLRRLGIALTLAFLCLPFVPRPARALPPINDGHFVVGLSGNLGFDNTGPKLYLGWAWSRAQLTVDLYGGAALLPVGPQGGAELSFMWVAYPGDTFQASLAAHAGLRVGMPPIPVLQLEARGDIRSQLIGAYMFVRGGFPQIAGFGGGGKLFTPQGAVFAEGQMGLPFLANGSIGMLHAPIILYEGKKN
jgi:hypothetical protein